jgi:hypothetical protein
VVVVVVVVGWGPTGAGGAPPCGGGGRPPDPDFCDGVVVVLGDVVVVVGACAGRNGWVISPISLSAKALQPCSLPSRKTAHGYWQSKDGCTQNGVVGVNPTRNTPPCGIAGRPLAS